MSSEATAMGPYSTDLRERVAAAVDHGEGSQREIAARFRVSLSFIVRLLQRRRDAGTLQPKPHGGGPPPVLGPDDRQRLAELIRADPDATLAQLKRRGGFTCSLKTLWRALRRQGLTFKKKSLHAGEQDRPDVQKERRSFRRKVKPMESERLVFVDETGVTTAMTPTSAWAPRGERAVDSAPASWESVTVIAALGLDGVRAPLALPGSVDTAAFQAYVDQVLVPALREGDVVIFDNLKPHLAPGVAAAIGRAGAEVLPLPPYSPDYTPMEPMYSKVKTSLRRIAARATGDLYDAIGEALKQVTPEDIIGWFKHAGLCATHG
jgi:transposase